MTDIMFIFLFIFSATIGHIAFSIEICGLNENNEKLVSVQNLDKTVESNGCSKPSFIQVLFIKFLASSCN